GFRGQPMLDNWYSVKLYTQEQGKSSDFPGFPEPIFSEKAVNTLMDLLEHRAEILEVEHPSEKYYAVNVIRLTECFNRDEAKLVIEDKYNIVVVKEILEYSFHKECIEQETIFKLKEKLGEIYVTDTFKNRVEEAGLVGFEFHEVWDSEKDYSLEEAEPVMPDIHPIQEGDYSFNEAWKMAEQGEVAAASGEWKVKKSKDGQHMIIGKWTGEKYEYLIPHFIPPILLDMKWKIVNKEG
ncbi:imm11 family protein, partial [Caldalkalibacillus salinus]|uniref:imm11 family protein n=1 Tax=Caldalkalibacillus salinus TaxID=2803787 RepID=UPI001F2E88F8